VGPAFSQVNRHTFVTSLTNQTLNPLPVQPTRDQALFPTIVPLPSGCSNFNKQDFHSYFTPPSLPHHLPLSTETKQIKFCYDNKNPGCDVTLILSSVVTMEIRNVTSLINKSRFQPRQRKGVTHVTYISRCVYVDGRIHALWRFVKLSSTLINRVTLMCVQRTTASFFLKYFRKCAKVSFLFISKTVRLKRIVCLSALLKLFHAYRRTDKRRKFSEHCTCLRNSVKMCSGP
jgi:hypothetical protein